MGWRSKPSIDVLRRGGGAGADAQARPARVDELRAVLKTIQEQQGRAEDTGKTRSAPKRRTKPEG